MEKRRAKKESEGGLALEVMKKKAAVKPKVKKRSMRRRTACVMAAAMILQGMFLPAWRVSAKEPEETAGVTASAGERLPESAEGHRTGGPLPATPSVATAADAWALMAMPAAVLVAGQPDPWGNWNGKTDYPGSGTEEDPYLIEYMSHLMGLSKEVAEGNDFAGKYIALTGPINLASLAVNGGNWNPIGWYLNVNEMEGQVPNPFRGHFDGQGNTIKNLKIEYAEMAPDYAGLFG